VIIRTSCAASVRSWYSDGSGRSSAISMGTGVGGTTELEWEHVTEVSRFGHFLWQAVCSLRAAHRSSSWRLALVVAHCALCLAWRSTSSWLAHSCARLSALSVLSRRRVRSSSRHALMNAFYCSNRTIACCSALWRVWASASFLRQRALQSIHSRMRGSASKGGGVSGDSVGDNFISGPCAFLVNEE
jgi:hypothetical protein